MKCNLDHQSSTEFIDVLVELIDSRKNDYLERYHIKQQNKCIKKCILYLGLGIKLNGGRNTAIHC